MNLNALEIYKAQYEEEKTWHDSNSEPSKYQWAASRVFDLTTYDRALDELFVKDIIEVCKVIIERRNFEYIKNRDNYIKYIAVCQILDRFNWLEWGTSIRGAWFEVDIRHTQLNSEPVNYSRYIIDELEWWDSEHHVIESVPFTESNIRDLIKFIESE